MSNQAAAAKTPNPFDQFDDLPDDPVLKESPRPGLAERFFINMEAATRQGTVAGALRDVSRPDNRERFDSRFESFPEWEGGMEGLAALSGQIAGTIFDAERGTPHLENLLPIGVGEKALALTGRGLAGLRARMFAGAMDAAVVNGVTDPIIQGIELSAGFREEFDPIQLASSIGLGAVAGGALGPISHRPSSPEIHLAGELLDWASGDPAAMPLRQSDFIEPSRKPAIDKQDPLTMPIDAPEGMKLDFEGTSLQTDAKRAMDNAGEDAGVISLGDRLQPRPQRPDTQAMAAKPDPEPLWKDNGTWKETDPDIIEVGQFGPVLDIKAHSRDWASVADRLRAMEAGEAPGALDHPDLGDIDVFWGDYNAKTDRGAGLKKIYEKHPEVYDDLPNVVRSLELVQKTDNRAILKSDEYKAVIRFDYSGEKKTWLLSAYAPDKDWRARGTTGRSDTYRADTSSAAPINNKIASKDTNIKESRRPNDTMARVEGHQADTSSTSLASQDMRVLEANGKADPDLNAAIAEANVDGDALQARLSQMSGELRRNPDGVGRTDASLKRSDAGVRLIDIANRLFDLTGVAAVRRGIKKPLGQRKTGVLGTHNTRTGVIRLKDPNDIEVIVHEVGHHIDKRLGDDFSDVMVLHRGELEKMAPPGYDPSLWLTEGFAEFFRAYLLNPNFASKQAPRFNRAFTDFLKEHAPDWLQGFADLREAYHAWRTMPSGEAVSGSIVTSQLKSMAGETLEEMKRSGIGRTIGDRLHNAYTNFIDNKHPIQQAVNELAKVYASNTGKKLDLKVKDDPYKLARMLNGAQSAGHMDLMHGVHGYRSLEPTGPALRDALIVAHGGGNVLSKWEHAVMQDFGTYLWSRRALGEWERFTSGDIPKPPDKFTRGDHEVVVREMEAANPQFQQAAEMVYEWNRRLWQKKRDASLISEEQFQAGLAIRDYVPGLRKQDFPGNTQTEGKGARTGKQNQVNQFRGSNLDVINPLESLMMDAYETSIAIAHNDMIRSLKRLGAVAGHGSGRIVEEIPAREMRAHIVDPIEAMESAARERGYSNEDILLVRDALKDTLGDTKAQLFRPKVIDENGQPIVFFREGGQLKALRLADGELGQQLYRTFTLMTKSEQSMLVDVMAASASMLRTGVTLAPEFIASNIIRDQAMAAVFYGKPFQRLKATWQGGIDELFSRDTARMYNQMGGIMGGENVASLRNGALQRDLKALEKKGYLTSKLANPLTHPNQFAKGLASITEASETATRIGLFRTFFDEARARGLDEFEAATEAAWLARDHIDFDRRGLQMVALSRIIPFLNASLQGLDKTTRLMLTPLAKKLAGNVLTAEEERAIPQAVKAWTRLSALTVAGMSLHALMSQHDDYHEISETTRATHWMVKTGNRWTAIPKPFELAIVLNVGEAAFDAVVNADPTASQRYLDGLSQVLMPPNIMESNPIVRSYFEAKSNTDFFTGAPIVPDALQGLEPALQYTARTSELTKMIGDALGWSPALTEKMITNLTGGLGRSALSLYDAFGSNKPGQSLDDMAILRRFIKSASKGARSSRKFWSLVAPSTGTFEGAAKSYQAFLDTGRDGEAAEYLADLGEEQRIYLTSRFLDSKQAQAKKLHPLDRARRAIRALSNLRKDLADDALIDGDGPLSHIPRNDRGAMVDILEDIEVKEARNALVMLKQPGWDFRGVMDVKGHYRELEALNPKILDELADRYATAGVVPFKTVQDVWPDYRQRLLEDGSSAPMADFVALAKHARELNGKRIKRAPKPKVTGTRH